MTQPHPLGAVRILVRHGLATNQTGGQPHLTAHNKSIHEASIGGAPRASSSRDQRYVAAGIHRWSPIKGNFFKDRKCNHLTKKQKHQIRQNTKDHKRLHVCVCVCSVTQLCLPLCVPRDCGPPGSSVLGIFKARIMEQFAISSPSRSSWPRDWIHISGIFCNGRQIVYHCTIWEAFIRLLWKLQANKMDNLKEVNIFWEMYNFPKLNQE